MEFNKFELMPNLPLNIIKYLVANNNDLFKMLKYGDSDCLTKDNLTEYEKLQLIWNGSEDTQNYRIFMDSFASNDLIDDRISLLRVFPLYMRPDNLILSNVDIGFEVICHSKINQLSNYQPRNLRMMYEVLNTLNGAEINGIGLLQFNGNNKAQYSLFNTKNYKGYAFTMFTRVV